MTTRLLSPNFPLESCLRSTAAMRDPALVQKQMNPPESVIENLIYVCNIAAQPTRNILNYPINVSSGYRCPEVNALIGGQKTSQHLVGEALDTELNDEFLTDPRTNEVRKSIGSQVFAITGKPIRSDVNANFYLFASICLHLDELDIDQVIHEFGSGNGKPAWIHFSASTRRSRREMLIITHVGAIKLNLKDALLLGC